MLGFSVGKVSVEALVLCLVLYLVARHEADYDFQKLTMVVAGTMLGNFLLYAGASVYLPPIHLLWVVPLLQLGFSAFMIKTFCWVTTGKALLVALICTLFHVALSLGTTLVERKLFGSATPSPAAVEQQNREMQEIKAEMMRDLAHAADPFGSNASNGASVSSRGPGATNTPASATVSAAPPAAVPPATPAPSAPAAAPPAPAEPPPPTPAPVAAPAAQPAADTADWAAARKLIKIAGITGRPGDYVALVNQRVVKPGDLVSVHHGDRTYRWTVREINRDQVQLDPHDVQ